MTQNPTIRSTVFMQQTVLQTMFMPISQCDCLNRGSLCVQLLKTLEITGTSVRVILPAM